MELLQDPNIIYLLLAGGMALGVLALASPGTGLLELGAVGLLVAAGGLIAAYELQVSLWALGVIIIGAALFALAVRRPRQLTVLALAIAALVLGSAYLFRGRTWWQPGVNPLLVVIVSLALVAFFWIAARKVIEAEMTQPSHDLNALIGSFGEARSPIHSEGSVYVDGELWSARSSTPIPDGAQVRVLQRDGFILVVEPVTAPPESTPQV